MTIDVLFLAAALFGFLKGFKEGIINSVFSVLSMVVALMAAFKFAPYMTEMLEKGFSIYNPLMFIMGFVVTFFLAKWLIRWGSELLTGILEVAHINLLNQVVGATVLTVFFSFLFSVLIWFADGARLIDTETKATSFTYRFLEPLREGGFVFIGNAKPTFQNFLKSTEKMMGKVKDNQQIKKTEQKTDIYDIPTDNTRTSPQTDE